MSSQQPNLVGDVPDQCSAALLLIDVINPLDFPEADELLSFALPMAREIKRLKAEANRRQVPVIYANDNFGRWRSDLRAQVKQCLESGVPGRSIVELLQPAADDYFVLKPKHSGFFSTTLETLLRHLGAKTLIIVGIATNICVLFTANDAYMRDFQLVIPQNCVAANTQEDTDYALAQMRMLLKAQTPLWTDIAWSDILQPSVGSGT